MTDKMTAEQRHRYMSHIRSRDTKHDVLKDKRAEYGKQVVKKLSKSLMERFGNRLQLANIYHFIAFYNYHPVIFYAVSRKSGDTG